MGLLVGAAVRRAKQGVSARVARHGLTARQFGILFAILEAGATSLHDLAARLRIDEPTASRVVTTLEKRGLVRGDVDPADRRRTILVATAAGEALRRPLSRLAAEVREAFVQGMSAAEVTALRRSLSKVVSNLDRYLERARGGRRPAGARGRNSR